MLEHWLNSIVPSLQSFGPWGYFFVFLIFFAEALVGIGLIIPGAIVAFLLGALAAKDVFVVRDLIIYGSLGFLIGDVLSFYLGRKGSGLFSEDARFLKLSHLEKGQAFFAKHGNKSVFIGRYLGFVRPLTPFIAGLSQMNIFRFLILNILSIVSWLMIHILAGFFFGQALWLIRLWSGRLEILMIYLAMIFGFFYLSKRLIIKNGQELFKLLQSIWTTFKKSLTENRDVQNFIAKHETFFNFFSRRLSTDKFSGQKFTIIATLFSILLYNFISLTNDVFNQGSFWLMDQRIENLMRTFKNFFFIKFLLAATTIASWQIIIIISLLVTALFYLRGREKSLIGYWLTIMGAFGTSAILKLTIMRPRPLESFYVENSYSFPSTHAAISIAMFGFLAFVYSKRRTLKQRINISFLALLLVLLIGFSRIYLRVHFLSDVIAGYLIGAIWLVIGIGLDQYLHFNRPEVIRRKLDLKLKLITVILFIFVIACYAGFLGYYTSRINYKKLEPTPEIATTNIIETIKQYGLSRYSESFDGEQQEPINLIISAESESEIIAAFAKLGWSLADKPNFRALLIALKDGLLVRPYSQLPISPSFWETEVNELAFTKKIGNERHYAKFWTTSFQTPNGRSIYVGIAAAKRPTRLIIKKALNPNIDGERELIFSELSKNKLIASWSREQFNQPSIVKKLLDEYFTDGKLYIIDLN